MLHVKHGHVLVQGDFEPVGLGGSEHGVELICIQIVGGGEALEFPAFYEVLGGEVVGDVEGEISSEALVGEGVEVLVVSGEEAVGTAVAELLDGPVFAGFEHTRWGDPDGALVAGAFGFGFAAFDGFGVFTRVFELDVYF